MLTKPMDVLAQFPIRKSGKQKKSFRDAVQSYVKDLGYESTVEKGSFGSRNIVIGDPEKAKYLVTAHYDTPAGMIVPNLITPCNFVTFILYQILVVFVVFLPAILVAYLVDLLTDNFDLAYFVWLVLLWGDIVLMMVGPANRSNANDNTSGVVTVLEIARALPVELREKVCFVLFDLEEAGLIGSASYRSAHKKASKNQIVLNLDCVGDGDEIVLFPGAKMRRDKEKMQWLRGCTGSCGEKSVAIREKGFSYYPSDQANFPMGVGIAALLRSKWAGLYLDKIHTRKDTVLEETNVNVLRDCLIKLISADAD